MAEKDGFLSMQACDWVPERVQFPCIIQVKIDGVAGYNRHGRMLGRSLKPHDNVYITELFSKPEFHGCAGELYNADLGDNHPDLCRITSGDLRRIDGTPNIKWKLFDYCTDYTKDLPYDQRMQALAVLVEALEPSLKALVEIIESDLVFDMQQLEEREEEFLQAGYEGAIIRMNKFGFKYGRCGKTHAGVYRIKRFIDFEILVDKINEGDSNLNEAKTNERGRTERSTLQENMQPNGLLGSMEGPVVKDVFDPQSGKLLLKAGDYVKVSPGEMDLKQRKYYWENPHEIVKHFVKAKMFPKGMLKKPRFPVYLSHRSKVDM